MKKNIYPIGITMGDPEGIGPEIILSAINNHKIHNSIKPIIFGNSYFLKKAANLLKINKKIIDHNSIFEAINNFDNKYVNCFNIGDFSEARGKLSYDFITNATSATMKGIVSAMVTAPINKEHLNKAGYKYPGHTELIAKLTNSPEVSLMLTTPKFSVIHVTTHMGILDAINSINPKLVYRTCKRGIEIFKKLGILKPKIGICSINPHAGENGLFGNNEEKIKILPAIKIIKKEGHDVDGPLPADALFYKAGMNKYDLIVAMYHDQGHCPVKVLGIDNAVNITIGLPIIRTSVDHGTAEDIAGKGIASAKSLTKAISLAHKLI